MTERLVLMQSIDVLAPEWCKNSCDSRLWMHRLAASPLHLSRFCTGRVKRPRRSQKVGAGTSLAFILARRETMPKEQKKTEAQAIGGSSLLTEVAADFDRQREALFERWRDRLGEAHPLGRSGGPEAEHDARALFDAFLLGFSTGRVPVLESSRRVAQQPIPKRSNAAFRNRLLRHAS